MNEFSFVLQYFKIDSTKGKKLTCVDYAWYNNHDYCHFHTKKTIMLTVLWKVFSVRDCCMASCRKFYSNTLSDYFSSFFLADFKCKNSKT